VYLPVSTTDRWAFKREKNGRWIWLRYSQDGEALAASDANYETLDNCLSNARLRGYTGPAPAHA
jgi:hypothetical protein